MQSVLSEGSRIEEKLHIERESSPFSLEVRMDVAQVI